MAKPAEGFARVTPTALLDMSGLNSSERLTFIALRSLAGLDVNCTATYPQLAALTGDSPRTAERSVAGLLAAGWVAQTREARQIVYYPRQIDANSDSPPNWLIDNAKIARLRAKSDPVTAKAESDLLPHKNQNQTVTETDGVTGTVANAPSGADAYQRREILDQRFAKPTVSPIPQPLHEPNQFDRFESISFRDVLSGKMDPNFPGDRNFIDIWAMIRNNLCEPNCSAHEINVQHLINGSRSGIRRSSIKEGGWERFEDWS